MVDTNDRLRLGSPFGRNYIPFIKAYIVSEAGVATDASRPFLTITPIKASASMVQLRSRST
jgi:hypothetical protein